MVFNILSMLFHSLLAYRMSAEKSADGLIEVSLQVTILFSWLTLKLSLCHRLLTIQYNVPWRRSFCFEVIRSSLSHMDLKIQFLPQAGKFSVVISSSKFFAPFFLSSPLGNYPNVALPNRARQFLQNFFPFLGLNSLSSSI